MESCAGAHHFGRELIAWGYQVKLMAPQFVKLRSTKVVAKALLWVQKCSSMPSTRGQSRLPG